MKRIGIVVGTSALVLLGSAIAPLSAAEQQKAHVPEVKVPFDQVPPAVKATLEKETKGAAIATVDKEGEGADVVYEADVIIDGKNWEIKVAPDGKLIAKKIDVEESSTTSHKKDRR